MIGPLPDREIPLQRLAWARLRDGSDTIVVPRRAGDNVNLFRVKLDGGFEPLTSGAGLEHWPAVSPSGELIFTRTDIRPSVWSLPIAPSGEPLRREAAPARMFGTSRDGSKVVFGRMLGAVRGELVLHDRAKGTDTVLASHEVDNGGRGSFYAHVSPDGTQVAYRAVVGGVDRTYIVPTAGGATQLLKGSKTFGLVSDWSLDGRSLIGECQPTSLGICALDPSADARRVLLSDAKGGELLYPSYSWDGQWVTFMLRRDGVTVIAVTPVLPDGALAGDDRWIRISSVDANGGRSRFSADGSALYYLLERASVLTLVRQAVDPATKRPVSGPVTLSTVSAIRAGLLPVSVQNLISVTRDRVFFNLVEVHGNVWLTRLE